MGMQPQPVASGMQSVSEVVDRLTRSGWSDQFRVDRGALHAVNAGCTQVPEDLHVDEIQRFEGTTDPGEEAIVLALTCGHGVRGTWAIVYGPQMDPVEADLVGRLERRASKRP